MSRSTVSQTARLVALGQLVNGSAPETGQLVPDRARELYSRWLSRTEGIGAWLAKRGIDDPVRWLARGLESVTIPGLFVHHGLRKKWIESRVRAAMGRDIHQVVVIGAGLDPLSVRLKTEHPELTCVEMDRESAGQIKRPELAEAGVEFVPVELGQDRLRERLSGLGCLDPSQRILFVLEGVSMYLPGEVVTDLLSTMADYGTAPGEVLVTVMEQRNGTIHFQNGTSLSKWWLSLSGEPFRWGCKPEEMEPVFDRAGLSVLDQVETDTVANGVFDRPRDVTVARGERLIHARSKSGA